ncbi:Ser/Thr and Tyr protein phosphatase [Lysobacter dokdonensis DS-58]|uniref:Ser/Thr and Tyr protein phosphatase n=1 Tax=Lysobacter dokdonensis DS-58 TaxID=1300345 RepID=A0A0A2WJ04_9GAMM|nr:phosphatase PAP2/dual specificity phosphatase family protein [Lysobacter dokdonensis]KGQ18235.1 Ser/Thr and Tyr protein phosphatase [Lysobacter dokdonensis DS-58]
MTTGSRPWRRALAWLSLLGPLFFASYGFANAMAARATDVRSIVFAWESHVPFLAWTIVPYWSIDFFYAASLFTCRDKREVDTHALRLLTAQVVSVACFLIWPLRFAFTRPETDGLFGWMFDVLLGFDKPFNQAPSLHIVLLVILWVRYGTLARGAWRWLLHAWFALIGVSVLTTFQHHFIDIPTGALAGWVCVWLWPAEGRAPWRGAAWARDAKRWRLCAAYAAGALACTALAVWLRGVAWWLLWPAVSLSLVALNYSVLGAAGFQKSTSDGRLSMASRWLFAPYLTAAWINSRWWTRAAPRPVHVADDVWLGRLPGRGERDGFDVVVDVSAELSMPAARPTDVFRPMLDLVVPEAAQLKGVARDIEAARVRGRVLVCCALGYSRSAASIAAWLVDSGRAASASVAIERVRAARPQIVLGHAHQRVIA